MMNIRIVDTSNRECSLNVAKLLSVDGVPYGVPNGTNLDDRIVLLEAQVADLIKFRDALLEQEPK